MAVDHARAQVTMGELATYTGVQPIAMPDFDQDASPHARATQGEDGGADSPQGGAGPEVVKDHEYKKMGASTEEDLGAVPGLAPNTW